MKSTDSRRTFVSKIAVGTAASFVAARFAIGKEGASANSKINVACVGIGHMGSAAVKSGSNENLVALCEEVLQPTREVIGPILVTSGYRSLRLNRKLRSKDNSQHPLGQAGDIIPLRAELFELFNFIAFGNIIPFDQVIYEFRAWVHVSFGPRHRRQRLRADRVRGRVVFREVTGPLNA